MPFRLTGGNRDYLIVGSDSVCDVDGVEGMGEGKRGRGSGSSKRVVGGMGGCGVATPFLSLSFSSSPSSSLLS